MKDLKKVYDKKNVKILNEFEMKGIKGGAYDNGDCLTSDPSKCDGPCDERHDWDWSGDGLDHTIHPGTCVRTLGMCFCKY